MLSDELGFSVPATEDSENGNVDPGEVTVDLPPQTAAYALLSKMERWKMSASSLIPIPPALLRYTDPVNGVFKKWTRKLAEFWPGTIQPIPLIIIPGFPVPTAARRQFRSALREKPCIFTTQRSPVRNALSDGTVF
ncbi:hypothetical protein NQ122_26830 [Klebsiella pneumoniae]|nr:hypothetical protein [Klebsiella pneumoniae]